MAYYTIFNCNWKQIRFDYPNLHRWLRELYYEVGDQAKGGFRSTTHFDIVSKLQTRKPTDASAWKANNSDIQVHGRLRHISYETEAGTLGTCRSYYAVGLAVFSGHIAFLYKIDWNGTFTVDYQGKAVSMCPYIQCLK
jgi:hypothetical protein